MQTMYQVQGMHMRLNFLANDSIPANCDSGRFNVSFFHESRCVTCLWTGHKTWFFLCWCYSWPAFIQIPSAWLSLFDVIFLIILLPVMDRVIYPRLDASGHNLSLRVRILIGNDITPLLRWCCVQSALFLLTWCSPKFLFWFRYGVCCVFDVHCWRAGNVQTSLLLERRKGKYSLAVHR